MKQRSRSVDVNKLVEELQENGIPAEVQSTTVNVGEAVTVAKDGSVLIDQWVYEEDWPALMIIHRHVTGETE